MGELVTVLNAAGGAFVAFAAQMLIQSSVLIILLAALDLVLRRRVKAVVRYWIWLLVLAKLILPPSLSSPTGVAYWVGGRLPTLSGPIEPLVGESSTPSLPADGAAVPSEPPGSDPRPSARYAPEEPPVARPDNTALHATPQAPLVTWQALVLLGWAVVVIVMAVLLAQRALFVHRLVAQSRAPGPEIVELLGPCARRMGVRTDLAVKLSPLSASPSVCGLRRPVILVPEGMLARLSVPELRAVLFHELAHIKRSDLWLNLLQAVLQVVYFYHPLLWTANAWIRRVREQAVDETVLAALGDEAEDYARTLLSVSRLAFGQPTLSLRLLGVVESRNALMDRIRHIASRPFPQSTKLGFAGFVLILGVGAALLPMARTRNAAAVAGRPEASAADPAVAGSSGNYVGDFVLDREIPVGLVAGTRARPRLIEIPSIRIEATYGNGWCATARVGWSPTVDSTWRIRLELLDSQGRLLRHARDRATVFTGKACAADRGMRHAELELAPLSWDATGRRAAAKIRVSLEPAQEPAPDEGARHVLVLAAVNGKDQKAISGATVIATVYGREGRQSSRVSLYSTDAQGECRIALPKAGLGYVGVVVQKEGYASMQTRWSNPSSWPVADVPLVELPERHVVEMVPAQTIGGVVRDEQGRPIAGVQVMVVTHLQEVGGTAYFRHNVLTDRDGRWRIGGIAASTDRLQLGFRHPAYAGDFFPNRQLTPDQLGAARASEYAAVLHPGLTVGGVVLNEQGRPVPNAVVILAPRRNGRFCDEYAYTRTEAAGRFRFDCALDDRTDTMGDGGATGIFVDAPGYVPTLQRVVVEPNLASLELRLQAGRTLTVRVVGPDGRPLAGAWTAVDPFTENREYGVWQADTDEQGRVQIGNVGENGVRLTVGKSGYITLRNHVLHTSDQDQVVALKPAPRVQGTVVDAETGQPIPNFDIAALRDGRSTSDSASHFRDGQFELSFNEAESKTLQLKISAVGYRPTTSEPISLEETQTLAFKLVQDPSFRGDPAQRGRVGPPSDEPGAIKGIVQDPNGRPVADAVVETCPWVCPPTVTDAHGKFKLRLEAGLMRSGERETPYLVARDRKQNLGALIDFDRTTAQDLVVKLAPALTLSGRVTNAQGQGMPQARLVLYLWLGNGGYPLSEDAKPDSDGSYEIRAVPPDQRCSVDVSAEGYGRNSLEVPSAAAVDDHVTLGPTALQLANLEVRGVVVDAEDDPVAGAGVSAYGQGQPFQRTETDAQGRFTIRGVCAGAVEMQANVRGEMMLHGRARVQGGAKDVKIVVSPIRLAGQPVPAQPASLVGKPLPSLADLGIGLPTDQYQDKRVLLCFFDMSQRPSRHCVATLAKQADALRTKDVTAVMVQAAPAEHDALTQ
jgi:beta-lactamase regulating signal transducer with metallopeptidase domain